MTTATFQKGDRVEFKEFPEVTEAFLLPTLDPAGVRA
jgi:hypothetical protein